MPRHISKEKHKKIIDLYADGISARQISFGVMVDPQTVHDHVQKEIQDTNLLIKNIRKIYGTYPMRERA